MTRAALKALIEPTQDGARFSTVGISPDPLMEIIQNAIDGADSDVSEVWESLQYAISQLKRAANVIKNIGEAITDDDTPQNESVGD